MEKRAIESGNPITEIKKGNKYILYELTSENHQVYTPLREAYRAYEDSLDPEISKEEIRGYHLIINDNLDEVIEIVEKDLKKIWRNQKSIRDRKTNTLRVLNKEEKSGALRPLNDLLWNCITVRESFSKWSKQ